MSDVSAIRRKYVARKTMGEIDGRRVDLRSLYDTYADQASVSYSNARQRYLSLRRFGPVTMAAVLDAFRLGSAPWKTAYGGGRHKAFVYEGKELPELVGKHFHGTSALLLAIGRYGDRSLIWSRIKAGWSLDTALSVPTAFDSNRAGSIYRVNRLRSGQFYVGLTISTVEQRWAFHIRVARAGANTKLAAAIREDGPEGFVVDILEDGIVGSRLLAEREKYWAEKLGAFGHLGLNVAPAGGLGSPRGVRTDYQGDLFQSRNEAAHVLGERLGIASHVVRSRLVQGLSLPEPSEVRIHSKHPEAGSNLFRRWLALLRRHPNAVVARWLASYDDFKTDVSPVPAGLSLVRKRKSVRWGPSNFEWVTDQTRVDRVHGRALTLNGVVHPSLTSVAKQSGLSVSTLKNRIFQQGMGIEEAVLTPLGKTSFRSADAAIVIDGKTFRSKRQAALYLVQTRGWTVGQATYRLSIGNY